MKITELLRIAMNKEWSEGKYLSKFPNNTEVHSDGNNWSEWDGKLAIVTGPDKYTRDTNALPSFFNPANITRCYHVNFALNIYKERMEVPDKSFIGTKLISRGQSLPVWSINTKFGKTLEGTFEKDQEIFWVAVKLKDLGKAEIRACVDYYKDLRYINVGDDRDLSDLSLAEWKKIFKCNKFKDTQNLENSLANAADDLIGSRKNEEESYTQSFWEAIPGIYKTTQGKAGKLVFILKK